ncbi:MAG: PKD domain-containing protein [Planctomycetes bacterium]|nr:PKD domain-containing protein [Planctomycetota bacterium]
MLSTLTVTTTADSGAGSLRQAIIDANNLSGAEAIVFNMAADDPGHVYYRDDGLAGRVTTANIAPTAASDDSLIADIDPDWAHSWWSVRPATDLPYIVSQVVIDGYSQPGSSANTLAIGSDAVHRIEVDGGSLQGNHGLRLTIDSTSSAGSTIRGMVVNGFGGDKIHVFSPHGRVEGNYLGTDVSGTVDRSFGSSAGTGIQVTRASLNGLIFDGSHSVIGGTSPAARNVIAGNQGAGVKMTGFNTSNNSATGVVIQGNYIGVDASGLKALGNVQGGVWLKHAQNTIIGGATPGAGNVISGNFDGGVFLGTPDTEMFQVRTNTVQGNFIGVGADGAVPLGNHSDGIVIFRGPGHLIGGSDAGAGNIIAHNGPGIYGGHGVDVGQDGTVSAITIAGNTIHSNRNHGVNVGAHPSDAVQGIRIGANSIHRNQGLGIDNGNNGVSANDSGDADAGPNGLQNFPVLSSVTATAAETTIQGTLNGAPNSAFRIEFFANVVGDPSGFGEGEQFLGSADVTTDGNGNASFGVTLPTAVPGGHFITATATSLIDHDADSSTPLIPWNTSEFSAGLLTEQVLNQAPVAEAGLDQTADEGATVQFDGRGSTDPDGDALSYYWDFGDGHTATGPTPIHSYADDGAYTVSLLVEDGRGLAHSDTLTVTVNNLAPTATFSNNGPVVEDNPVTVAFSNQFDPSSADTAAGFLYSYDFNNDGDFADTGELGSVTDASASVLLAPGDYTVRGRIQDKDGGFNDYTTVVKVLNVVDLRGQVFNDLDNDGLLDVGEDGLAGVVIELVNGSNGSVVASATTDGQGAYEFDFGAVGAGTYTIRQQAQPSGFLDGKESIGNLDDTPSDNGTLANNADSNAIIGIAIGAAGTQLDTDGYNFAEILPSSLQGLVWEDFDDDGGVDFGEYAVGGASITVSGSDDRGNAISLSQTTDSQGIFEFVDLRPGTYTIGESQPAGYIDGKDVVGYVNGVLTGDNNGGSPALSTTNDQFTGVVLAAPGSTGINYNFGERVDGGTLGSGQTATIGYWQNKNGQALIESLNGSNSSTLLATYLSETFPNMYGRLGDANGDASASDPMTNVQVADFYESLFKRNARTAPGGPPKVDAQVMAVALATYITKQSFVEFHFVTNTADSSLVAGVESFGFDVTIGGVGSTFVNVGANGAAFNVADNSDVQIIDLLLATNRMSRNGLLYDDLDSDGLGDALIDLDEESLRLMANDVYTAINEAG